MATSQQFEQMFTTQIVPILKQETTANTGSLLPRYNELPISNGAYTISPGVDIPLTTDRTSDAITWVAPITTTDWSTPLVNDADNHWTIQSDPIPPNVISMEELQALMQRLEDAQMAKELQKQDPVPKKSVPAKPSLPPPTKEEIFAA